MVVRRLRRTGPALALVFVLLLGTGAARAGDDLLTGDHAAEPAAPEAAPIAEGAAKAHDKLFAENRFPSATVCRTCHPDQYREWAMSQHSYAQLSPVLQAMQGLILKLTNVSNGDFCIRCHNQVGMNLGEKIFMSSMDRHPTSREGITCIVCHRVGSSYGKVSGRMQLDEGPIFSPVKGPTGNAELKRVLSTPDEYHVVTEAGQQGRGIHTDIVRFPRISTSAFCGQCHDVNLANGLRLEEAFSEWKHSPASKRGVTCQDCHMSTEPGKPVGYAVGPAAVVGGVPTRPRKRTDTASPDPTTPSSTPASSRTTRRPTSSRPSRSGSPSTGRPAGAPGSSRTTSRRGSSSRPAGARSTTATTRAPSSRKT